MLNIDARHDILSLAADEDLSANSLFGVGKLLCRPVPPPEQPYVRQPPIITMRYEPVRISGVSLDQIESDPYSLREERLDREWDHSDGVFNELMFRV